MTVSVMLRCSQHEASPVLEAPQSFGESEEEEETTLEPSQSSLSVRRRTDSEVRGQVRLLTDTWMSISPSGCIGALTPRGSAASMLVSIATGELHRRGSLGLKHKKGVSY